MCTFKTSIRRDRMASITFNDDGSVNHAYTYILGMALCDDPRLTIVVENAFEIIFSDEIEVFKKMLYFIKNTNPKLYKKGWDMLEERKKLLRKEVERYTL